MPVLHFTPVSTSCPTTTQIDGLPQGRSQLNTSSAIELDHGEMLPTTPSNSAQPVAETPPASPKAVTSPDSRAKRKLKSAGTTHELAAPAAPSEEQEQLSQGRRNSLPVRKSPRPEKSQARYRSDLGGNGLQAAPPPREAAEEIKALPEPVPEMAEGAPQHIYECPMYRLSRHNGALLSSGQSSNLICTVNLPTAAEPSHWILAGASLVCETDE